MELNIDIKKEQENAQEQIKSLQNGEVILLDNVRYLSEEMTLFENKLGLSQEEQAETYLVRKLAPLADLYVCDAFAAAHAAGAESVPVPHRHFPEAKEKRIKYLFTLLLYNKIS